jgi:hypothetical protein
MRSRSRRGKAVGRRPFVVVQCIVTAAGEMLRYTIVARNRVRRPSAPGVTVAIDTPRNRRDMACRLPSPKPMPSIFRNPR